MEGLARKFLSTKFISMIVVGIILFVAFFVLVRNDIMDSAIFMAWLGAILTNFGIYAAGNVASKKYKPD